MYCNCGMPECDWDDKILGKKVDKVKYDDTVYLNIRLKKYLLKKVLSYDIYKNIEEKLNIYFKLV